MDAAARRAGREPGSVELVAVTKYASDEAVLELARSGRVGWFAENRVQDAEARAARVREAGLTARWRLVGHLQTNKAAKALEVFEAVDSVDSDKAARALQARLEGGSRVLPVLVQVKLSERETQSGADPGSLEGLLATLRGLDRLKVEGLMAIAPLVEPLEAVRPHFRRMKGLFDRHFPRGGTLSMGMSGDFETAIEEGATMVRVGSAIFDATKVH